MKKCAIITGIFGQDGSLLADYLLSKNYTVIGLVRNLQRDFPYANKAQIQVVDICDPAAMRTLLQQTKPHEFYHLAAAHHSSDNESDALIKGEMLRINFQSTQVILDALLEVVPQCRFLFAGSSQMYTADQDVTSVDENTPYRPSTFYGVTKTASANLIDMLRRQRGLWGVTAMLFNHESVRRDSQYMSRKVTHFAAQICKSEREARRPLPGKLFIRDITARTDWSAATDFVRAMHLSLQAAFPQDYIFASGKVHSVRELLEVAFGAIDLDWHDYVDLEAQAPLELQPCLQGNPQRARDLLGWEPSKTFEALIQEMVQYDLIHGS